MPGDRQPDRPREDLHAPLSRRDWTVAIGIGLALLLVIAAMFRLVVTYLYF